MTDVIWRVTVDDGSFECKVVRTDDYTGQLVVIHIGTDEVLLDQEVTLAYRALFGPDVDDVRTWQVLSLTVIDQWLAAH